MRLSLRYDLRRAPAAIVSHEELYASCLDQCAWADRSGFDRVALSEHHGSDDGYCGSVITLASAIAARTDRMTVALRALLAPLHDPVRLAEDLAVLDLIAGGRLELLLGLGYRPTEYAMFGKETKGRGKVLEETVEVLKRAWTGEDFEYRGTTVKVTPRPVQRPRPQIVLAGSSDVAARRAARIADGYDPVPPAAATFATYRAECERLGVAPNRPRPLAPRCVFLMVAEDPDKVWQEVAPYALHEANSYARWNAEAGLPTAYPAGDDAQELRRQGAYRVITPEECVELAREVGPDGELILHPLMGGLPPDLSWTSLQLFADQVSPALVREGLVARPEPSGGGRT